MTLTKLCELLVTALEDLKAENIKVLNVSKLTSVTDIMIIASGRSNRQVRALAEKLQETGRENGIKPLGMEGQQQGEWILIDFGDIVVHVMQPAAREYYQLEKLWDVGNGRTRASTSGRASPSSPWRGARPPGCWRASANIPNACRGN